MSRHHLPAWLAEIRDAVLTITGPDLTAFLPPEDSGARPGAVLMLFGEGERGPDLLLTERAHDMRSHPGQVSFPGGSVDEEDEDAVAAALREAEEEVGVDPAGVDVLATLPELWTTRQPQGTSRDDRMEAASRKNCSRPRRRSGSPSKAFQGAAQ